MILFFSLGTHIYFKYCPTVSAHCGAAPEAVMPKVDQARIAAILLTPPATEPYDLHLTLCQTLYQSFFFSCAALRRHHWTLFNKDGKPTGDFFPFFLAPRFAATIGHYSIKMGTPREIFFSFFSCAALHRHHWTLFHQDGKPKGDFFVFFRRPTPPPWGHYSIKM